MAVTVPACWFLWPDTSHADSGHHGGHEEHEEHEEHDEAHEEKEEEAPQEEEKPAEEPEQKEEPKEDSSSEQKDHSSEDTTPEEAKESEETAKPSGTQGDSQPASNDANKKSTASDEPEQKETPENKGNTESQGDQVNFKGKISDDAEGKEDTRKREPDSKGAYKKRIDSGLGKELGAGPEFADSEGDEPRREAVRDSTFSLHAFTSDTDVRQAATSKTPQKGSEGDITGKQAGLSTTATKHSTKIDESTEKSTKGEGTPETAKAMGTVDPNRPQK